MNTEHWSGGTLREALPLFAEDAVHRVLPNREPDVGHVAIGRAYDTWQAAASDVRVQYADPVVDGDRAVLEWWCEWIEDGQSMMMAGMTKIWVNSEGLVVEGREYWSASAGAMPPYEGWNRDAVAGGGSDQA